MKTIEELKKDFKGKPKQDKINYLKQEITNYYLSNGHIPLIAGSSSFAPSKEEVAKKEVKKKEEKLRCDVFEQLLKEVEENHEAYESNISNKELIPYIYDRNIDWYLKANPTFVFEIISYFEEGERKGYFDMLDFLNLLWKQKDLFEQNSHRPFNTLQTFQLIPLSEEQKHIILGFILKYFYSKDKYDLTKQEQVTLQIIEKSFFAYEGHTPEKAFCLEINAIRNNANFNSKNQNIYQFSIKDFESFSSKNDLDFYFNTENIPNSKLVFETYNYFENGFRKGYIEPLAFLNLLWKQKEYFRANIEEPYTTILELNKLPLNKLQKHILFGFILKWHSGYPISVESTFDKNFDLFRIGLKLIEKEFLKYEEETPEKEFCKRDWVDRQQEKDLSIKMTALVNGLTHNQAVITHEKSLIQQSLIDAISQKPTITEKLNYWLEIKDNFKDIYPQLTSLSIPDSIYKIHFEMYENDVEFTYWLLKYSANSWFDSLKSVKNLDKKLDSPLAKDHIEAELKEIYAFEEKAKAKLKAKKFDIYEFHYNSQYQDEIEYLRIVDKYYEKKGQRNPLSIGEAQSNSKQVMAYVTHILLKNYLLEKLKEISSNEVEEVQYETNFPIKNTITDFFNRVRYGNLGEIDIYNEIEKLSENFNLEKLKLLENDLSFYLFVERENRLADCTHSQIEQEIERRKLSNLPIPYLKLREFSTGKDGKALRDKNGKVIIGEKKISDKIDLEALLFPYEFFQCYRLENLIKSKISQRAAPESLNIGAVEEKKECEVKSIKTDELENTLKEYLFFEIDKIKNLSSESKKKIIAFLSTNDIPYQIAMIDFLGFDKYLLHEFFNTKIELYQTLSEIFGSTERTIKGNMLVLNERSKENKERYTAHNYKETVKNDYNKLK